MNVAVCPDRLDILSLCTGGGGLDLGIELACPGARTVCMVEREAFAVAHLVSAMQQGLLAPAAVWSDARTFDGRRWRGCVDGVIGGIPCQPHSLAGRKRGSLDERDLWTDARRIIVQARPWFVLIENVGGMLSAGADEVAGAERVWRDLRKLGFRVEIGLFTAAEVGAPHERERLFILGVNDELADARRDEPRSGRGDVFDAGEQSEPRCGALVYAKRSERRTRTLSRHQPDGHDDGRDQTSSRLGKPSPEMADANISQLWGESSAGQLAQLQSHDGNGVDVGVFPPGPADLDRWRGVLAHSPDLEPAVRRMADGVAARVDLTGPHAARVERLRMLGNGVVSLEGAHAFRTLCARLAGRGSPGAARLVRMMEAAE